MRSETRAGHDILSAASPPAQKEAGGTGDRKRSGPRSRAYACLVSLVGTNFTGLLVHSWSRHGEARETVYAPGSRAVGPEILHVVFAVSLTVLILWHLFDKRRLLAPCVKRRNGQTILRRLAYVMLMGLLVASLLTGFAGDGRSQVAHHAAVAAALTAAYAYHSLRRMVRRRRLPRRESAEAGS